MTLIPDTPTIAPDRELEGEKNSEESEPPRIRCPLCGWSHRKEDKWFCECGNEWNTFNTGGVCPACLHQRTETQCLSCSRWPPRHRMVSGSRPLPSLMSLHSCNALTVLAFADKGRINSPSFDLRRTGFLPSESVSSWYPSWICDSRSCSVSVYFRQETSSFLLRHCLAHRMR